MHRPIDLDDGTADRLLGRRLDPADAPPGYAAVAELLRGARGGEGAGAVDEDLVPDLVRAIEASPRSTRKPTMQRRSFPTRLAGVAAITLLTTAGAAAAATGTLPDPAQDAVAEVADAVGIDLPTSATETGHADNPTDADAHGEEVSTVARNTESTGREHGEDVSTVARAGHGPDGTTTTTATTAPADDQADDTATDGEEHGRPADPGSQAPVETPNAGGVGTGTTASDGANETGADHAADAAQHGSANAEGHPTPGDHPTAEDNPGRGRQP